MRCFIAVPIPEVEKERIRASTGQFRSALEMGGARISWVKPEGMHITLAFLGEPDDDMYERIRSAFVGSVPDVGAFTIAYEGIGWFPARGIPRVLFTGLREGIRECTALEHLLRATLSGLWKPDREAFSPHITLGRVKYMKAPPVEEVETVHLRGEFGVNRMVLYESLLKSTGAEYRPLETINLRT